MTSIIGLVAEPKNKFREVKGSNFKSHYKHFFSLKFNEAFAPVSPV